MSEISPSKLIIDPDFTSIHANGLKIKYDGITCRLIFYQKTLDMENNEIKKDYAKTLKFEVILPVDQFQVIGEIVTKINERPAVLREAVMKGKTDDKTMDAWCDYFKESSDVFYDTDETNKTDPNVQKKLHYFLSRLKDTMANTDESQ